MLPNYYLVWCISTLSGLSYFVSCDTARAINSNWWTHAVFYQIYPRSFKDNNNDGIGDLQGIISKLDHLKDAGITAAWLSPIYKSPQVDQGYDISDFKDIDEKYGTLADFDELLNKAHAKGIKIIMDFVPNHSSNQHEWFSKSERNESGYENFYVWRNGKSGGPPNNWISIFKNSAWEYSKTRGQYYLHQFTKEQPDLNFRDPILVNEMKDILKFWMDRGVDGFRMDAVPYLFEDEQFLDEPFSNTPNVDPNSHEYLSHIYTRDLPQTFDMIYQWRKFIDDYVSLNGGDTRVIMTEAYTDIENTMKYYGNDTNDGAHFTFNFQFITKLSFESTARDIILAINEWLAYMPPQYTANWVLGNHDNHRTATRFGAERVDGMNMLAALLPGIMITYNGEEIGQEDGEVTWEEGQDPNACNSEKADFDKLSRDFERTPFHWNDDVNAGFNTGGPTWLPVSIKYTVTNLKAQSVKGIKSQYHTYQELLKLRQEPAFVSGSMTLKALSNNIIAFTRGYNEGITYVVIINIGNIEETVNLSSFSGLTKNMKIVATNYKSRKYESIQATNKITLAPYESIAAKLIPDKEIGDKDWWKHTVFYQIYPRSFKDNNNDGIGDLQGVISKLDHLKDAGITAAWLSPIYKSPQVDQGYDISDFKDIDEKYGTLADFDELLNKAHAKGIKIIMDFVPNHSSNQHEWFSKSERNESGYENFYVWKNGKNGGPPNNWISLFKNSAWEYSETRRQYYLHQFAREQPDLNYRDPILVKEMEDILKFWLDRGVDGFRMDAVPYIFEDENFLDEPLSNALNVLSFDYEYLNHIYTSNHPQTYEVIYQWRKFVDDYINQVGGDVRVIMTEAYTDIENTMKFYGNSTHDGAHFTFNFQFITKLNNTSSAKDIVAAIEEWMNNMPSKYIANWVLGNHDNHRLATRFGPERADGMNLLIAILPGIMVTYNGEEIGQENGEVTWEQGQDPSACSAGKENFQTLSRDFERTPFQWNASTNAGFNEGAATWLPVSTKYEEINLASQLNVSVKSHYQIYKQLIKLREYPTIRDGNLSVKALSDFVLGGTRGLEGQDTYVFLINLENKTQNIDVSYLSMNKTHSRIKVIFSTASSKIYTNITFAMQDFSLQPYEGILAITENAASAFNAPHIFFYFVWFCSINLSLMVYL